MEYKQNWFFYHVAGEVLAKGFDHLDFEALATAKGVNEKQLRERFPTAQVLVETLIDEIFGAYKGEVFRIAKQLESSKSDERLIQMLSAGFDFFESKPILAQVIMNAVLGTNSIIQNQVFSNYEGIVQMVLDDLLDAQIMPFVSQMMIADFRSVMLSLMLFGGCPDFQMDYLSFLNTHRIMQSALKAFRTRYHSSRFAL